MAGPHLYPRRDLATRYLRLLLDRPHTALSLFGPRQIGKTTFITGDLSVLASSEGIQPIYVDLMAAEDKLEAINGALREAAYTLTTCRSQERVRGVKALGVGVDFDASPPAPTSADAGQQLQHLVSNLLCQSGVHRVLLLLDEVQELARGKGGDVTMNAVRAVANKHKVDGRVLMTESSKEGLTQLFAAHGKPSFGLAERQDFPVLGRDYVEHVRSGLGRRLSRNPCHKAFRICSGPVRANSEQGNHMNHVVAESMALSALAEHYLLASCTSDELKSVRQFLSLVHAGTPLSQVADGTIKMALSAARGGPVVSEVFGRSGIRFVQWHRRTKTWSLGMETPASPDGSRGGWVLFETSASTDEEAKERAERYVASEGALFTGGHVALISEEIAMVGDIEVRY